MAVEKTTKTDASTWDPEVNVQYVKDARGRRKAVVVPVDRYCELLDRLRDLATRSKPFDVPSSVLSRVEMRLRRERVLISQAETEVTVPARRYRELLDLIEDLYDLRLIEASRNEPTIPWEEVQQELRKDGLLPG